ncbi:MAG TPA: radical SAM family heme chaperone HemW, partial [bacterium]|nr:radical SAM family heme chaperone HemW [bacterium]
MKESDRRFGLYVNLPFCKLKCNHCDYTTVKDYNGYSEKYIDALIKEINNYKNFCIKTIYLGGGTPSILKIRLIEKLYNSIKKNFKIEKDAEFTIEINPDDVNKILLKNYKDIGINRVSLGTQTFNDKILRFLGRRYDSQTSLNSLKLISENFENFSCDLLFAVPKYQTLKTLKTDVEKLLSFKAPHISIYNLVIEKLSYFGWLEKKNKISDISDTLYEKYYLNIFELLTKSGYNHYELSTYSKSGFECKHNLIYWKSGEYIGTGSSAHSHISGSRIWNYKYPKKYIDMILETGSAEEGREFLS